MATVSRSDIYVRDENGPAWFNDFLQSFANSKPASIHDILDAINNKRSETVDSVVQSYCEQVGLDVVSSAEDDKESVKHAKESKASFRPLSIRHANEEARSIVERIKEDPKLQEAIDSHCEHSGGTKNRHALIHVLRELLGGEVSFSDDDLNEYLEERKNYYRTEADPSESSEYVGRVGIDSNERHDDEVADFMRYDGAKQ